MIKNSKKAKKTPNSSPDFAQQVRDALFENDNSEYREIVDSLMDSTGETAAEIAAALVGMLLAKSKPAHAKKANTPKEPVKKTPAKAPAKRAEKAKPVAAKERAVKPSKPASNGTVKVSITGGKNKRFTHKDVLGALAAHAGIKGTDMKDVQIAEKATYVSVSSQNAAKIIASMNSPEGKIKGVPVKAKLCTERKKPSHPRKKA